KYIPILHGGNLPYRLNKSPKKAKMIFNNSYANVAPSNYLKSAFEKGGYKTHYIPNTIKIEEYQFKERTIINPNILWVRAFDSTYNPQMAVEVLQLLKKDIPKANLTMVGPIKDDSFELTKQLISELNLKEHINITGILSKEEWHKLSVDFDIFINTTNVDNTPLSVIEAMALGMPIISTNVGGLPFLIDNEVDGILVSKGDVDGMTNAIVDLLNNHLKAINLTLNARKKVENFGWSQVKSKWINLLK
ncbi:MAG: glycosyltransferase family 4 protein, partial [Urechidicola sp.]|nr:glycosyltransferase family 4 protein [Urechidicola sp.]